MVDITKENDEYVYLATVTVYPFYYLATIVITSKNNDKQSTGIYSANLINYKPNQDDQSI
jgi:hypothetical protein